MWNLSKNSFLLSPKRSVFLKSECKSTNYFPNTQEFRQKSLKINSYLTVEAKNKRLSCPTLIILYTRERGSRVCGRTGEGKSRFQQQKPNNLIFQYTRLRNPTHIYAVYSYSNCRKTRSQPQNHIAPTGKIFFPNWEIIFSQLSTACWRINIQKLSSHGFRILLRVHKTYLLKPNLQGKDLPRLLRLSPVVYYDQRQPSIKTKPGRLLRPKPTIIENRAKFSRDKERRTRTSTSIQQYFFAIKIVIWKKLCIFADGKQQNIKTQRYGHKRNLHRSCQSLRRRRCSLQEMRQERSLAA